MWSMTVVGLSSVLIGLVQPSHAFALGEWMCTETSSQRFETEIFSCGIGEGGSESAARLNAFDNSKAEFERICDASDDCKNHKIYVDPQRTTCSTQKTGYKCYRMIVFKIRNDLRSKTPSTRKLRPPPTAPTAPASETVAAEPSFTSRSPTSIKSQVLHIGMKKEDVIAALGTPKSESSDPLVDTIRYEDENVCERHSGSLAFCYVYFDRKSRVLGWDDIHPEIILPNSEVASQAPASP